MIKKSLYFLSIGSAFLALISLLVGAFLPLGISTYTFSGFNAAMGLVTLVAAEWS